MNNKGFVFIETIIAIVVLMTTLLVLYSSFNKVVLSEQNRLYHDDISYVYKTKHIAQVLIDAIDYNVFTKAYDNAMSNWYIYIFNTESTNEDGQLIYRNQPLVQASADLYQFYRLIYIKIDNIKPLKNCLSGKDTSDRCSKTKTYINSNGYTQLEEYLKTIDTEKFTDTSGTFHDSILVALFYEAKNGDQKSDGNKVVEVEQGKYSECVYNKVKDHYAGKGYSDEQMFEEYNEDDDLNFDMACQNAYYISWVYL